MIVGMKKITLLCLEDDTSDTLSALHDMGILHISPVTTPQGTDLDASRARLADARSVQHTLDSYKKKRHSGTRTPASASVSAGRHEILETVQGLLRRKREVSNTLAALRKERLLIEPYGHFDPMTINRLTEQGVTVRLYHVPGKKPVVPPEGTHLFLIKQDARGQYFAITGKEDFEFETPEFPLPERSLHDVCAAQEAATTDLQNIEDQLAALSNEQDIVNTIVNELEDELRMIEAREGMGAITKVAYLMGFCPVDQVSALQEAATKHGWGIVIDEPASDDNVPTLIRNPAWVRTIDVLFRMLDILPGYHEVDIRSAFLIFFTLFFAILVGDAGYGLIFLLIAGALRYKMKKFGLA